MASKNLPYRWVVNRTNPEYVNYVSKVASVSPAFAQILISRGIKTPDQLNAFLNPDIVKLSDPFELPDMRIAIERVKEAKKYGQKVLIHGDYDADGVTATAILVEGLRKFGIDVHYFIPNRISHGYGFSDAGISKAKQIGAKLIITVDCGITSFDAVNTSNSNGIDVIITDHHEPLRSEVYGQKRIDREEFLLPAALAIVNPKIQYCNCSTLSGAGIAFMFVYALFDMNIDDVYELLDLAAIGTSADIVPVVGDNRIILREGIKLIQSGNRVAIKALKKVAGISSDYFKTSFLYYILNPRINAAGRIADANDVVRFLATKSEDEAEELAKWLNDLNLKRQEIEGEVYSEAKEMIERLDNMDQGAIVLASEGWHIGVVGIVASRIAEEYYRPTFVLSLQNGYAKGSARSIPAFDIYDGLTKCKEVLKGFGGHKQAAGLSLLLDDIECFKNMISNIVLNTISPDDFKPLLSIDAALNIADINFELIHEITRLEPFGYGNDEPLFGSKGLEVIQPRIVGNNHLKLYLKQNGSKIDSIGFDLGDLLKSIENSSLIDAAFLPTVNEWDGGRYLQLNLKAIRPSVLL